MPQIPLIEPQNELTAIVIKIRVPKPGDPPGMTCEVALGRGWRPEMAFVSERWPDVEQDILPDAVADMLNAFLYGDGGDVLRAHTRARKTARKHRKMHDRGSGNREF